jgi:hypothetical protein
MIALLWRFACGDHSVDAGIPEIPLSYSTAVVIDTGQ